MSVSTDPSPCGVPPDAEAGPARATAPSGAVVPGLLPERDGSIDSETSVVPDDFRPSKAALLSAVVAARDRQRAAEIEKLALVSALCDAYACLESNPGGDVDDAARILFGERLVAPSFDGTGPVGEFLGHELGPALGISPDSAWRLVWDVLALRHRHPVLWSLTLAGEVECWRATAVARACTSLPAELARALDSELGPRIPAWGPVKTRTEVDRVRARLDPAAEAERQAAKRSRSVEFYPHPMVFGITGLEAQLDAVDARHLDQTLTTLADTLRKGGTPGSAGELRAIALGHLAHPDRAARLLHPDLVRDGAVIAPDGSIANGATGEVHTSTVPGPGRGGATLVVHLTSGDLGRGGGGRLEGVGQLTRGHLDELLAGCAGRVTVRPVVDLAAPLAVATYKPSPEIRWRIQQRDQRETFPYSQRSATSRRVDLDHTIPYGPHGEGGPTSTDNLGSLSRRTHRGKTHARYETVQERPGTFRWTTPLGRTYWTNPHGTWTTPPPEVVTNDPDRTTETVLRLILQAAASERSRAQPPISPADVAADAAPPPDPPPF